MKKTLLLIMLAFTVLAANAQKHFTFVYLNSSNTRPNITLFEGNYIDSTFTVIDTVYTLREGLPFKTVRTKFKEPKPVDKWQIVTVCEIWNEPTKCFIYHSCSIEPYKQPEFVGYTVSSGTGLWYYTEPAKITPLKHAKSH